MSQCPKCGASLSADFGMVACASCASMLFIDMEGVAHISGSAPAESRPEPAADFDPGASDAYESPLQALDDEPTAVGARTGREPELESSHEPLAESFGSFLPQADFDPPSSEDPLGLNAFASSEVSQAKDGPLVFRLLLSGIDSKEMRESIREALLDARFGWDASALMAKISKGRLAIDGLSPVKATVLVNRLKRMPIRIAWEQYAVTQIEAPPAEPLGPA